MKAHESDILLVGTLQERQLYRQFTDRQIVSGASFMRLDGRRVRHAYATDLFWDHRDAYKVVETVKRSQSKSRMSVDLGVRHISRWLEQHAVDEVLALRVHISQEVQRIEDETGVQVTLERLMGVA